MKVLVTGAAGFIGRNLVVALRRAQVDVAEIDRHSPPEAWTAGVRGARVLFHLAGVNRAADDAEYHAGNVGPMHALLAAMREVAASDAQTEPPLIVLASSAQASLDNPYGRSKLAAEQALESHAGRGGQPAVIYRLPGVFGKWCPPNRHSVVATFCHNIARDLPITITDPARVLELLHVDDVVRTFVGHVEAPPPGRRPAGVIRAEVRPTFTITLGELAARIREFRAIRDTCEVPDTGDPLTRRLFGTYTSYLPLASLPYRLEQRTDARGTLAELLKSRHAGQLFVSRTHPGVTRGHHYHDCKVEKFCVLEGEAVIRFRAPADDQIVEHRVSGTDFIIVDIPPGTAHSIENVGAGELVVLFWASEIFDRDHPDTHSASVTRA